jgi:hypothetical protein
MTEKERIDPRSEVVLRSDPLSIHAGLSASLFVVCELGRLSRNNKIIKFKIIKLFFFYSLLYVKV